MIYDTAIIGSGVAALSFLWEADQANRLNELGKCLWISAPKSLFPTSLLSTAHIALFEKKDSDLSKLLHLGLDRARHLIDSGIRGVELGLAYEKNLPGDKTVPAVFFYPEIFLSDLKFKLLKSFPFELRESLLQDIKRDKQVWDLIAYGQAFQAKKIFLFTGPHFGLLNENPYKVVSAAHLYGRNIELGETSFLEKTKIGQLVYRARTKEIFFGAETNQYPANELGDLGGLRHRFREFMKNTNLELKIKDVDSCILLNGKRRRSKGLAPTWFHDPEKQIEGVVDLYKNGYCASWALAYCRFNSRN